MQVVKNRIKVVAILGFAAAAGILFTACAKGPWTGGWGKTLALDPGGFSVNFLESWQHLPTQGDNLVKNGGFEQTDAATGRPDGWNCELATNLPADSAAKKTEPTTQVTPLVVQTTSKENAAAGRRCLRLSIPNAAGEKQGTAAPVLSANCFQDIALPPLARETTCVLSYRYRGSICTGPQRSQARVFVSLYDDREKPGTGKMLNKPDKQEFFPLSAWNRGVLFIGVPTNAGSLRVAFQLENSGDLYLDDVAVRERQMDQGLSPYLMPGAFLDNLFCLSSGDPVVMGFQFDNGLPDKTYQPDLMLRLPAGVKILDCGQDQIIEAKPAAIKDFVEYRLRVKPMRGRFKINAWYCIQFLLSTSLPAGDKTYPCAYWIEDGEYRSAVKDFDLKVIPAIAPIAPPKTFKTGVVFSNYEVFTNDNSAASFTAFYKRLGFNAVDLGVCSISKEMGRVGIERYTQPNGLANGYQLGSAKKPDEVLFRLVDGKPRESYSICPVEVYTRGPYFKSAIENDIIRKLIITDRSTEQIMSNWEPFNVVGQGCFCNRCKEEFRAFSKLPQDEFERVWPREVLTKHKETWTKFRRWQHAKLVVTLEETVNSAGREVGLDSHFIPEVHYAELHSADAEKIVSDIAEFGAAEYMDKLPVLEPWGPYPRYFYPQQPYGANRKCDGICGMHMSVVVSALETQEFLASRLPEKKRPRLIAFPSGTASCCCTQPEAIWFEFLTYFVNGYAGAFAYPIRAGSDARYWNALASANRQIARFEPFVCHGKMVMKHELNPETPLPKSDRRWMTAFGTIKSRLNDLPLLLSWEFEKDGKRLIAVGNFWERGEVFFRLTPKELKDGIKYVLWEPDAGRCYADSAGTIAFSAAELAKGMLLHAGALRYSFFVLEPWQKDIDYGVPVRPQDMEAAMRVRHKAIQEAYIQDDVPRASAKPEKVDYSSLKSLNKDGLECKPVAWPGISTPCLSLRSSSQSIILDPGNGGRIVSWKVGDFELAQSMVEPPYGLLVDAFLYPNVVVKEPYTIAVQEETGEGIKVTLQKTLGYEAGVLTGLTLRKTIEVPVKGAGFQVVTGITNTSGASEVEFAYRSHNMPVFLEQREGQKGWACMDNKGTPVVFDRQGGKERIFRRAGAPDMALDIMAVDPRDAIGSNVVEFGSDRSPVQLRVTLKGDLYSIYYSGTTFEPVFSRTTLKRGETWTVEMEWQVSPVKL